MSNQTSFVESTLKKLSKTNNIVDEHEACYKKILITQSHALINQLSESDGWNEKKDKAARDAYNMARYLGTYEYYQFIHYFPEDEAELVKCPTCEEMIYSDAQDGMCIDCFKNEQKLYPDDIPMELRYRN